MHSYTGDDEKKIGDLHEPMTEDSDNAVTEDFGDRTEDPDDKTEDSCEGGGDEGGRRDGARSSARHRGLISDPAE
ncbi:hypothetical protein PENNAL_c0154G01002 [Penicillium nalgiovense]|uniref:Uncharacterized protein n=1 Tax=Penicillium nalgiovense TaxID=60175 RepID=A0A1V6WZR0_PENNA|nr:hypothetical protein PENNAL_c0154G01002 [Penicillium nalgiovense]